MTKQLTDEELRIEKLSDTFTKSILLDECQKGKCFTTCYPLSIYLEIHKIKSCMVMGNYKIRENIHYWLTLEDSETIVDPTIKQFDKTKPQIFIGKDSDYQNSTKLEKLDDAIYKWELPFVEFQYEIEKQLIPKDFNEKVNLGIILRAATILHSEVEKFPSRNELTTKEQIYFYHIKRMVNTGKTKKLIAELKPSLPKEFENLLSKLSGMAFP